MNIKQVISIKEARKILGKDAQSLTDDQVIEIIDSLTLVARRNLEKNSSKNKQGYV